MDARREQTEVGAWPIRTASMLITSQFVVLNVPKTGSTWVRNVLKAIHERRLVLRREMPLAYLQLKELILPNIRAPGQPADQHGIYEQIPEEHRHKPVLSVLRNPYERLLSTYEFRWWAKHPPVPREALEAAFPHFPALSLDDYVGMIEMAAELRAAQTGGAPLGVQTVQFIQFFFREPARILAEAGPDYFAGEDWRRDMADVSFLRQEALNAGLAAWLDRFGYSADEVDLCRTAPRILVTEGVEDRGTLWTARAVEHVRNQEAVLLSLLERLGHRYEPPAPAAALVSNAA